VTMHFWPLSDGGLARESNLYRPIPHPGSEVNPNLGQ